MKCNSCNKEAECTEIDGSWYCDECNEKQFFCLKCKKDLTEVNVDGYSFGDRMLEGVMYRVKNNNGKPEVLGIMFQGKVIDPKDDAYMHQLNYKLWNKRCEEYCEGLDVAECPECGFEIIVWDS